MLLTREQRQRLLEIDERLCRLYVEDEDPVILELISMVQQLLLYTPEDE